MVPALAEVSLQYSEYILVTFCRDHDPFIRRSQNQKTKTGRTYAGCRILPSGHKEDLQRDGGLHSRKISSSLTDVKRVGTGVNLLDSAQDVAGGAKSM